MPGEPSTMMRSRSSSSAILLAWLRTRVTSFPEFSSAIPSRAWTIGPYRVPETNHSPLIASSKTIASSGQFQTQTPHPSQSTGSIEKAAPSVIASKRQTSLHWPQAVHWSARIRAIFPPLKSSLCCMVGSRTRCRSAASTSQSARTLFFASAANEATRLVLPVPPFPLTTTSSFTFFPLWIP